MRILGLMVTRNEAGRYLGPALTWAERFLDDLFVLDDQSDDGTAQVVADFGAMVAVRPNGVPSFIEHEGAFRQAAWDYMSHHMHLGPTDWVFSFDADEFLTSVDNSDIGTNLRLDAAQAVENAKYADRGDRMLAVGFHVPEVFHAEEEQIAIRTDGYWDKIFQTRLVRWEPGQRFADKPMACGSVPERAIKGGLVSHRCKLLHFGYANPEDRIKKHQRYMNRPGHSTSHVASIVSQPKLRTWEGVNPLAS